MDHREDEKNRNVEVKPDVHRGGPRSRARHRVRVALSMKKLRKTIEIWHGDRKWPLSRETVRPAYSVRGSRPSRRMLRRKFFGFAS